VAKGFDERRKDSQGKQRHDGARIRCAARLPEAGIGRRGV